MTFNFNGFKINAESTQEDYTKELAIEKLLNIGMTESDIECFTDEQLKVLFYSKDLSYDKEYYYIPDDINKEPVSVDETTVEEALMQEELKKENNLDNSMRQNMRYVSSSGNRADDTTETSGGYLRQNIVISNTYGDQYFVSYSAVWLKKASNHKTDVFGAAVSNATLVPGFAYANYFWSLDRESAHHKTEVDWKTGMNELNNMSFGQAGVGVVCPLMTNSVDGYQTVHRQQMSLSFYVTKDNPNIGNMAVAGYYQHQESTVSVSPSIT